MTVKLELNGMIKKIAGWKKELILDLPDNSTISDALLKVDENGDAKKMTAFATLNNKKVDITTVLNDGDVVKVFPKAFGG